MTPVPDLPAMTFATAAEWEAWLDQNHATSPGVWMTLAKKGSGATTVSRADALDLALCYGWIDSQAGSIDDRFWRQRFTPRRRRSKWSQVNCTAVEALIAAGRMKPAGLAQVQAAKDDGRWDAAYAPPSTIAVPSDLQERLDREPAAQAFFDGLSSQNRYAILYRIADAKRPETRARRIEKFVRMLIAGETLH